MSRIYEFPSQEKCYAEASEWIAKLDKGLSAEEREALQHWMAASRQNRDVLMKMAALWDKMDTLSRLADLFPQPVRPRRGPPRFFSALAASVVIAVLAGVWGMQAGIPGWLSGFEHATAVVDQVYETAVGEHSTVNLPDGTQMVLNTDSLVRVDYTDQHRVFSLERGEIHIQVAHDKTRPLSVLAGDKVVQAVGTAFNVEIYRDRRVELIVTDGKVLVGQRHAQPKKSALIKQETLPQTSMALSKGEKIVLGSPEEEIQKIEPEDVEAKLSWRQGNLIFRGEALEDAVAEISRYTSVKFEFLDDDLKKVRVAGLFKAGDVNGLLVTLNKNFNIDYQRVSAEKILLKTK